MNFSNRYLEQQLGQNLHSHMHVFSWIKLKLHFQGPKVINLRYGLDTPTIFFLFRLMVKKNLKSRLWQILMPSIPIFTYEWSKKSIDFLDLDVALSNGRLESTVHITPTDRHQYLHYSSSHPRQAKRSTESSQTLSINRICSWENDF